jgi:predicted membrane protein
LNSGQSQVFTKEQISSNGFLIASVICSILSLMSCCIIFGSMIFAAMAIVFAILSKGKELKMHWMGKLSIFIAIASLVLSTILTAVSIYSVMSDPEMRQEFYQQYEQMTGISFEDTYGSWF